MTAALIAFAGGCAMVATVTGPMLNADAIVQNGCHGLLRARSSDQRNAAVMLIDSDQAIAYEAST